MRLELTKRGDYGIRAILALARAPEDTLLSVRRIAEEMAIPRQFLPQVMSDLGRARLVVAVAGRAGGYRLARSPSEITILDVVEAVEGDSRRRTCVLRGGPCSLDGACDVHDVFFAAQDSVLGTLSATTLADLPVRRGGMLPWRDDRADGSVEGAHRLSRSRRATPEGR
jgi:Rrf2 family protein